MTHGTVTFWPLDKFAGPRWKVETAPHVRIKLKRVFPALEKCPANALFLGDSYANCEDLEWFLDRYPHNIAPDALARLTGKATESRTRKEKALSILAGTSAPPIALAEPLRLYQSQAVEICRIFGQLLCGDDLGLGKTLVGIGLMASPQGTPAVVVCQTHLQKQWRKQLGRFAPLLTVQIARTGKAADYDAHVLIIPYSKIHGWADYLQGKIQTVVFDEAQELRHDNSKKYAAAVTLATDCASRLALTATPVYNYGGEVFNVINVIAPGALGSQQEFYAEWCEFGPGGKMIVKDPPALGAYLRESNLFLRRTTRDVGRELPKVTRLAEEVPYNEKIFNVLKEEALGLARVILGTGKFEEKGQAAREFSLKLRQATGIAKAPFVAEFVADLARKGIKVLLTGWHREVYEIWKTMFRQEQIPHVMFTGTESPTQKDWAVKTFCETEGGAVFIMSNRSGAGLDGLQYACETVVFGELDWSPKVHEQITGRVNRDGQANPCTAIYLVSEAGSDPIMAGILGIKMEQSQGITDPDVPVDSLPATEKILGENTEGTESNVKALAKDFMARYGGG